jgi:hypothetical protein
MTKNRVRHAADLFCDTSIGLTPRAASTRQGRWVFVPAESDSPKTNRGPRRQFGASLSCDNDAPSEEPQARARERPDLLRYDDNGRVVRLQVGDVLFCDDRHAQDVL